MREFKFNDDAVNPNVQRLLDLKIDRRFISKEQMDEVEVILNLANDSLEELRAKRNSVVKILNEKLSEKREKGELSDEEFDNYHATISGTVCAIDSLMASKYGSL